ncbi:ovarian cancer G-protein coupled receptor 1-like [Sparus aurata]|uniref:ovarian cancer G-protein coupled receptor 1-like n=1 Tax=Sparus aurata TaxID=8175 RepID=UPI0011C1BEC6|nr:ovarian cancer G-protein coupled receptor 1-like [Sparus aurata]
MAVFNITNTSQDNISDYLNTASDYDENRTVDHEKVQRIMNVVTWIIISVGLPLTLVAIYALYSMVRGDHVAPIYIINLLISNLIQFCCMIVEMATDMEHDIEDFFHSLCQFASICFMVCIALERYLLIAYPLWYRFSRTIKISVAVSVAVWVLSLTFTLPLFLVVSYMAEKIICCIFLLLPLPLLIFFLGGTIRALSASRVPSDEKRRIVGTLVLVLLIYTLLLLPSIILVVAEDDTLDTWTLNNLSAMFVRLSPLADLLLYVFMRKGIIDKLLAAVCCCRMDSNDSSRRTKSNNSSRMNSNDV